MMSKKNFYLWFVMALSVFGYSQLATANPLQNISDRYSSKFITPVYQDRSRFNRETWTTIGCQRADYSDDRYILRVARNKGPFNKLRLKISSDNFRVVKLRVVFYNGERERLTLRPDDFYSGQGYIIDLPGRRRYIEKIVMRYGSRRGRNRPIVICIDGHEVGARGWGGGGFSDDDRYDQHPVRAKWKNLGCDKAKHRTKSRYFRVGRAKGRFKALRFTSGRHAIRVKSASVTFENGRKKPLALPRYLSRRSTSEKIEFGRGRFIKVVDIRLKTRILFSKSTICLQGLPARGRGRVSDDRAPALPYAEKWRSYGCVVFRSRTPRSKFIPITTGARRLTKIRLAVSGSTLGLRNLGAVYRDGSDDVFVSSNIRIRRGASSEPYRLRHRRRLKEVEIVGRKGHRGIAPSTVCIEGR